MKPQKYHRLPQPRVDKVTYEGIKEIARAQEMNIAEVIRAALREYISKPPDVIAIPVAGTITPRNGEYIILSTNLLGLDGDKAVEDHAARCPQEAA